MSQWAGGVLTAAGRILQAKVEAGTTALVLTKIKLGDGTESMDAVDNLTDLVGPKAVLGISSAVSEGDHATITGVVLSTQLQAGFTCREWGLFATDPDAGEILYMITIDAQPEWLPASTAAAQVSATYAMNIAVANATNIEVNIDPAGLVDVEMLQSYMGIAKRSIPVAVEETAMLEGLPAGYFLECKTGGTTGASAPVITPPVSEGATISDGSVVWIVRKTNAISNTLQMGVFNHKETFTASGSFTAPVTGTYRITLQGAGAGGSSASSSYARLDQLTAFCGGRAGGGGGGLRFYAKLTKGTSYQFVIGAGGTGGAGTTTSATSYAGAKGTDGGTSSITIDGVVYEALGGTSTLNTLNSISMGGEGRINGTRQNDSFGEAGESGRYSPSACSLPPAIGGRGRYGGGNGSNGGLGSGGFGGSFWWDMANKYNFNGGYNGTDGFITFEYCDI